MATTTPIVTAFTTLGDSFEVQIVNPLKNVLTGDTFTLQFTVTGVPVSSIDSYITMEYRWSDNNGQSWSEWVDSNDAIGGDHDWSSDFPIDDSLPYLFEWRAELTTALAGTATSVNITAVEIDHNVSSVSNDVRSRFFKVDSLFNGFMTDDVNWVELRYNILEKVKGYGIVDGFVIRTESFVHFWKNTVDFISLCYMMGYRFANIYNDAELLRSYLIEKGLIIPYTANLSTLQGLADDYIKTVRNRGTLLAVTEIQTIINKQANEFYQSVFIGSPNTGWHTSRQSPCCPSLRNVIEMNLMPEAEWHEATSVSNYETIGNTTVITSSTNVDGETANVLEIDTSGAISGIKDASFDLNSTKKILIDTRHPWEFSAWVKGDQAAVQMGEFAVALIDVSGTAITCVGLVSGASTNSFILSPNDEFVPSNAWVKITGVIRGRDEAITPDMKSYYDSIGHQHLQFPSTAPNYAWAYPTITFNETGGGNADLIEVYGVRVAISSSEEALGGLTNVNNIFLHSWNNNSNITDESVTDKVHKYILDTKQTSINIEQKEDYALGLLASKAVIWLDMDNTIEADGSIDKAISARGNSPMNTIASRGELQVNELNGHNGMLYTSDLWGGDDVMFDTMSTHGLIVFSVIRFDALSNGVVFSELSAFNSGGIAVGLAIVLVSGDLYYGVKTGVLHNLGTPILGETYKITISAISAVSAYIEVKNINDGTILSSGTYTINFLVDGANTFRIGADASGNYSAITLFSFIAMRWHENGGGIQTLSSNDFTAISEYVDKRYNSEL